MQVQRQRQRQHKTAYDISQNPEDLTAEDFIFPSFCKPGLGQVCEYCQIRTGYSIRYRSFNDYLEHVFERHPGCCVYAFDEDLEKACKEQQEDYKKRLRAWQKQHIVQGITWLAWK